ncbi:conserved hypothetical protein [uncultured Paludibacter sp.]|uniref:GIY-YIG domain-containing protein n=1 Tax=uncultured Paludibacter sp. TaxID=497635 RepID=A0A653AFH3_9BACT|nr:conserved hypothetical protein [uncultured Paludibacter sp.]
MVGCYILYSEKIQKFYIGATQDEINSRIEKHNHKTYGSKKFTARANDWILFLFIPTKDFSHAVRIKRKIKSMKSSKFVHKLMQDKELLEKLITDCRI